MTEDRRFLKTAFHGPLMMLLGTGFLTANDAAIKLALADVPLTQAIFIRGLTISTAFLVFGKRTDYAHLRSGAHFEQTLSAVLLLVSMFLFGTALIYIPVSTAVTAFYANPIFVVLLAPLILKERLQTRYFWCAMIGLLGVSLVTLSATFSVSWAVVLVLGSAVLAAFRDLYLQRLVRKVSTLSIIAYSQIFTVVVLAVPCVLAWTAMTMESVLALLFASACFYCGVLLNVGALRTNQASYVAPFKYAGILWSVLFDVLLWHHVPSPYQFIGAAILIGSGVYLAYKQAEDSRQPIPLS